jgi:hypothetical protein
MLSELDPQGFWDLLGTLPWHADTLLQISEVYRHRDGEYIHPRVFVVVINMPQSTRRLLILSTERYSRTSVR